MCFIRLNTTEQTPVRGHPLEAEKCPNWSWSLMGMIYISRGFNQGFVMAAVNFKNSVANCHQGEYRLAWVLSHLTLCISYL